VLRCIAQPHEVAEMLATGLSQSTVGIARSAIMTPAPAQLPSLTAQAA
jgi:hypothetical protein